MSINGENMSQEEKIVTLSSDMRHLTDSFNELKDTLKKRDTDIHDHINRKFTDEMRIGLLELEKKIVKDTDTKIAESIAGIKSVIKTWAILLVFAVTATVGSITYLKNGKTDNSITIEQATSMYETVTREVTKANKAYLKATKLTGSKSEIENIE